MLQKHWEKIFKPNMFVKCSMQVRADLHESPGLKNFSEPLFAGIRIPNSNKGFSVKEGDVLKIPVEITMPVGCKYPINSPKKEKFRKENVCYVHLFNAVPKYQRDKCENGIVADSLKFITENCGLKISHHEWNTKKHIVTVRGECDKKVNKQYRLIFLRLWSDSQHGSSVDNLAVWNDVHLPDVKILVIDTDELALGQTCHSHNDPHMKTFDGEYWELQNTFKEPTPGEYIMYKHERLPQQINGFFKSCNYGGKAVCNCGVAIRSGDSIFVANFCETEYKGKRRVNRYVASWMCDDQNLVVEEIGNKYKVVLPSGTEVEFGHGPVSDFYGIHRIDIRPSNLDFNLTSGLCGKYDHKQDKQDFVDRKTGIYQRDIWEFAKSWKVDGTDETLFNPYGKLPELKYKLEEYCTCHENSKDGKAPPEFDCISSKEMLTCKEKSSSDSVYHASCLTSNYRSKRDVSTQSDDDEDERPPMFPVFVEPDPDHEGSEEPIGWRNGLSEEIARNKCRDSFVKSSSFDACSTYVPSVKSETYVEECINDMKILGDDSFLKVTLDNFASSCLTDAKRIENLTDPDSADTNRTDTNSSISTNETQSSGENQIPTFKTILEVIEESTCPDDCSNKGVCRNGVCKCYEDYFGIDCSLEKTKAPILEKDAFESICDSSKRPCRKYSIPGRDFYRENLTCKFRPFQFVQNASAFDFIENTEHFTHRGIYKSSFLMFCEVPEVRRKRFLSEEKAIATGYFVSVSNDGLNFTEELIVIAFDTRCFDCNVTDFHCRKQFQDDCPYKPVVVPEPTDTNQLGIGLGIAAGILVITLAIVIGILVRRKIMGNRSKYNFQEEMVKLDKDTDISTTERLLKT